MLDVLLMLQAEHGGGNSSTFTCRVLTSSGTDPYSAYSSAICSLKDPRHGGANLKVIHMLDNFKENIRNWNDEGEVADYMRKVIRKEANDGSGLIYGMGHAVYTISDPRAIILKKKAPSSLPQEGKSKRNSSSSIQSNALPPKFSERSRTATRLCAQTWICIRVLSTECLESPRICSRPSSPLPVWQAGLLTEWRKSSPAAELYVRLTRQSLPKRNM